MKVLKLSVDYDGYYGGSVHKHCLLPVESNGLYIEELEEGLYEDEVYLGEIEGKHSEVYGDLKVEVVDLDELTIKDVNTLIDNSDTGNFESFFEGAEETSYCELFENDNLVKHVALSGKRKDLELKYSVNFEHEWTIKSTVVSEEFVNHLKDKYQTELLTFTIKKEEENKFRKVMKDYEIEVFE